MRAFRASCFARGAAVAAPVAVLLLAAPVEADAKQHVEALRSALLQAGWAPGQAGSPPAVDAGAAAARSAGGLAEQPLPNKVARQADAGAARAPRSALLEARPYRLVVPATLARPATLVVLLHGYGSSGLMADGYLELSQLAREHGFVLAIPEGTVDERGARYWNATDACCSRYANDVDDVGYLSALIDEARSLHGIDSNRVFVIGHSNGGFMAHRLACDRAEEVAGIVSFAGATWTAPERCSPTRPVNVLQVHGTADQVIRYAGGAYAGKRYSSANETAGLWAQKNGCGATQVSSPPRRDLVEPPGAETREDDFEDCPVGGAVSLWSLENAGHSPALREGFSGAVLGWLSAHPRQAPGASR